MSPVNTNGNDTSFTVMITALQTTRHCIPQLDKKKPTTIDHLGMKPAS